MEQNGSYGGDSIIVFLGVSRGPNASLRLAVRWIFYILFIIFVLIVLQCFFGYYFPQVFIVKKS